MHPFPGDILIISRPERRKVGLTKDDLDKAATRTEAKKDKLLPFFVKFLHFFFEPTDPLPPL